IRQLGVDAAAAEQTVKGLASGVSRARQALRAAQERLTVADTAFRAAGDAAKARGANGATTAAAMRQELAIRQAAVDHASRDARQQVDGGLAAQGLVDAASTADAEARRRQRESDRARATL